MTDHDTVATPVLQLIDLEQHFPGPRRKTVRAVDGISLSLSKGETVGLVGESGSGKTTVGRTALRLYRPTRGRILFEGNDVSSLRPSQLDRVLRRRSAMIFQNPSTSLNPYMRIIDSLMEPLEIQAVGTRASRYETAMAMLEKVGLDPRSAVRYPRELSGGQRQRIGVGRALMLEPSLIVADEPTAALDVSVQAQVINLMADLQAERGLAYLFISHELSLVRHISHRVAVMYLGRIVEVGTAQEIFDEPLHPYTVSLASMTRRDGRKIVPRGDIPSPIDPPSGCHFHTRCPIARKVCATDDPAAVTTPTGRSVMCHFPGELSLPADERPPVQLPYPVIGAPATRPVETAARV
jgi:oligopeptide/dipeptide ABC transporter ATP-binding protein